MARQSCKTTSDELWMIVNQRPLRFSKMEYALITGLDCSEDFPEVGETMQFRDRHFCGNENVYIEEVATKLMEMRKTPERTINLEKLKLACLYFGAAVLWPVRQKTVPQVDNMLLSLVEDLDLFNKYPWGTIAYNEVLKSIKRDLTSIKLKKKKKNEKIVEYGAFTLNGFVHPLQILAYECIPGIAKKFAKRRDRYNMILPRMCGWISNDWHVKSSPKYNEVVQASHECLNRMVISVLTPTELELHASYIANGHFSNSDPNLSHVLPLLSERQNVYCYADSSPENVDQPLEEQKSFEDMQSQRVDAHDKQSPPLRQEEDRPHTSTHIDPTAFVGEVPSVPNYFVQLRDYIDEKFTKLQAYVDERFTKIEEKLEEVSVQVKKQEKNPAETSRQPTSTLPEAKRQKMFDIKCVNEEVLPSEGSTSPQNGHSMIQPSKHILHTPQRFVVDEGASNAQPVGDANNNDDKKTYNNMLLTYVRVKRQIKKSSYLSSPFMELSETPPVLVSHQLGSCNGTFQPLQIAKSPKLTKALKEQIKTMKDTRQCLMAAYDKKWFNDLLLPRSWLGSSHINECMNGFLVLQKRYPHLVAQDIAIMGGYFSGLLGVVHSKAEKGMSHCHWDDLIQMAEGSSRKWKSLPWK
ncbi:uncharacterized protein [Primulina eburnea]|uniref:uncharacterized protein isoform X1 n=2 Tax=Primulina eburnea TaxID=1245227 RepID=UPI003C6BFEDC